MVLVFFFAHWRYFVFSKIRCLDKPLAFGSVVLSFSVFVQETFKNL